MQDFKISIHKTTSNREDDYISFEIFDPKSCTEFFRGKMSMEAFAQAITGLSRQAIEGELRCADQVGKFRVYESRSTQAPDLGYGKRDEYEQWLRDNCQEEGWAIDAYLRSQGSISFGNPEGTATLKYGVFKFVDEDPKLKTEP